MRTQKVSWGEQPLQDDCVPSSESSRATEVRACLPHQLWAFAWLPRPPPQQDGQQESSPLSDGHVFAAAASGSSGLHVTVDPWGISWWIPGASVSGAPGTVLLSGCFQDLCSIVLGLLFSFPSRNTLCMFLNTRNAPLQR